MKKSVVFFLHLGYWFMYLLLILMLLRAIGVVIKGFLIFLSAASIAAIVPALIGFYFSYGFLFKNFLAKKKILKLTLYFMLMMLLAPIITQLILRLFFGDKFDSSFSTLFFSGILLSFISLINGITGLVMKGFISWYADIKVKVELNQKNHETELALMKAQLDPHFLFNTINNIDVLILKDPNKASQYLNKLSDMMRFMLYETKTDKIDLEKELTYIQKYIDLQKIRSSNSSYVNLEVSGSPANLHIEPMLFIPFIENAFKHTENKKIENAIKILVVIKKNKIHFECENAYSVNLHPETKSTGIGDDLIKRRLALLYPGKHQLDLQKENGIYKVTLSIKAEWN